MMSIMVRRFILLHVHLDQGPIIIQGKYTVPDGSDESSLQTLTHNAEHIIYPIAVKWFAEERDQNERGKTIL